MNQYFSSEFLVIMKVDSETLAFQNANLKLESLIDRCPRCQATSDSFIRNGYNSYGERRYKCKSCGKGIRPDRYLPKKTKFGREV